MRPHLCLSFYRQLMVVGEGRDTFFSGIAAGKVSMLLEEPPHFHASVSNLNEIHWLHKKGML